MDYITDGVIRATNKSKLFNCHSSVYIWTREAIKSSKCMKMDWISEIRFSFTYRSANFGKYAISDCPFIEMLPGKGKQCILYRTALTGVSTGSNGDFSPLWGAPKTWKEPPETWTRAALQSSWKYSPDIRWTLNSPIKGYYWNMDWFSQWCKITTIAPRRTHECCT